MKIRNLLLTLILVIVTSGCFNSNLKYSDVQKTYDHSTYTVPEIYVKRIIEGKHTESIWYTDGISTIRHPKGNYYITTPDIELLSRKAKTPREKRQKGLLVHENGHMFLTRHPEMWRITTRLNWYNEQFGYAAQIRYLVLVGEFHDISDRITFIRYISRDTYKDMATVLEATIFVNWAVMMAKAERAGK